MTDRTGNSVWMHLVADENIAEQSLWEIVVLDSIKIRSVIKAGLMTTGLLFCQTAVAAEKGTGFYLLGTKGPLAAVLPNPGWYLQNDTYYYNAGAGGSEKLPVAGTVGLGIRAHAIIDMPTLLWSTPYEIGGGRLALAVTAPFGRESIDADFLFGPFSGDVKGSNTAIGDPIFTAMLGWNQGNWHWSVNGMLNVPIGDYDRNALSNIAFHHWGGDVSVAATWLNPTLGLDVSGVLGFSFNGKNSVTEYRTGTEMHIEGAISQYLSPQFSIGVIGYYYQQISDDSGAGAHLGGFRGRVAALGATASYSFELDKTPVTARVKVFREFAAKNRLDGTGAYLTLSVPLGGR
uniref:SphA family protein n=1 Tax=Paenochrobactrum sp. BZR 201-1 TaxID=3378075 RepID=UPI0038530DE9